MTQTNPNSLANLDIRREERTQSVIEAKDKFLAILTEKWPNIAECARNIGMSRQNVFDWRVKDKVFAAKWDEIEQAKLDQVENHIVTICLTKGGAGYGFPLLKAYRRHIWGDKTELSGQIANVHLVSGVRQDTSELEVTPAGVQVKASE
jgi:hypothetical protein